MVSIAVEPADGCRRRAVVREAQAGRLRDTEKELLGEKELIKHKEDGPRYVYYPAEATERARNDVLAHVVRTYFAGSPEQAVTALLRMSDVELPDAEVERLRETIRRARQNGR